MGNTKSSQSSETRNPTQDSKPTDPQKNSPTDTKDSVKDDKNKTQDKKETPETEQSNSHSEQPSQTNHQRNLEQQKSEQEKDQSTEQWLRRIPDDPSGLLREKFRYESMKRQRNREPGELNEKW